jgi:hypothetical protein
MKGLQLTEVQKCQTSRGTELNLFNQWLLSPPRPPTGGNLKVGTLKEEPDSYLLEIVWCRNV